MSRKLTVYSGIFALLMALPLSAHAGPWTVMAGGGVTVPTGDFGAEDMVDAKIGYRVGGGVDYRVNEMFAVGVDGTWGSNKHGGEGESEDLGGGLTFTLDEDKFDTWHVGAHGKYFIPAGASLTPYLLGGIGVYSTTEKWEGTLSSGGSTSTESGETKTDSRLGFKFGAGANFSVSELLGIGVQGDYNIISQDKDKVGVDNLQYIGVSAALIFNLMQ